MSLFPWKPIRFPIDVEKQLDTAFSRLIDEPWGRGRGWQPEIDVYETEEAYLIEADLPGVKPEDIDVQVSEHAISISGTRSTSTMVKTGRGISIERRHGSFSRHIALAHAIDPQQVEQGYEEGIFHLRLPKRRAEGE